MSLAWWVISREQELWNQKRKKSTSIHSRFWSVVKKWTSTVTIRPKIALWWPSHVFQPNWYKQKHKHKYHCHFQPYNSMSRNRKPPRSDLVKDRNRISSHLSLHPDPHPGLLHHQFKGEERRTLVPLPDHPPLWIRQPWSWICSVPCPELESLPGHQPTSDPWTNSAWIEGKHRNVYGISFSNSGQSW